MYSANNNQADFIECHLEDGRISCSFSAGGGILKLTSSHANYMDGNWHTVSGFCYMPQFFVAMALVDLVLLFVIIWQALQAGKMNQILHCDWLPERARWSDTAPLILPVLFPQ